MWLLGFLFAFGVVDVYYIQKDVRTIRDDLSYLVDLLEQNPDLVKKATDQAQPHNNEGDQMGSRRDLYK